MHFIHGIILTTGVYESCSALACVFMQSLFTSLCFMVSVPYIINYESVYNLVPPNFPLGSEGTYKNQQGELLGRVSSLQTDFYVNQHVLRSS
jgi:hypothetical protein